MMFYSFQRFKQAVKKLVQEETLMHQMIDYALIMERSFKTIQIGMTYSDNTIQLAIEDSKGILVGAKTFKKVLINTRKQHIIDIHAAMQTLGYDVTTEMVKIILDMHDMACITNESISINDLSTIEKLIIKPKK